MSLDFTTAKIKHTSWKLKLRDFLDGKPGLNEAQATDHTQCDLGKWLLRDGIPKYGHIPEMKTLERVHETLHSLIRSIMELRAAGKIAEAEAEYLKVEPISRQIVELLSAVEQKVTLIAA